VVDLPHERFAPETPEKSWDERIYWEHVGMLKITAKLHKISITTIKLLFLKKSYIPAAL